ncbi:MAG TPA: histone deacetylase family protein [Ilumatobacteraceae bacterium]|nr:histone deacetylase family protein [Ilumatobacteraceae bacterium]
MLVISSDRHRLHAPLAEIESSGLQPPFEHPGRADAIRDTLAADDSFSLIEPTNWDSEPISAVHDPGLVEFLERAWADYQVRHPGTHDVVPDVFAMPGLVDGIGPLPDRSQIDFELGRWCFETTTPITEGTFEAARSAVDVALSATAEVLGGETTAYGLCRPPGHHAPTGLYGGYCFFNNAAIAAHHVASTTGTKVTVLDVDYHHGNGTQQIFYGRDDVQYVSLHGDPARAYPYVTGFADERGAGRGIGANLNVPLAVGTDDDGYLRSLEGALEAIAAFGAGLLIVSLGVDTFHNDPISDLAITTDGFRRQGEHVAELGLATVVLQEGGYDVAAIGDNVRAWLLGVTSGV